MAKKEKPSYKDLITKIINTFCGMEKIHREIKDRDALGIIDTVIGIGMKFLLENLKETPIPDKKLAVFISTMRIPAFSSLENFRPIVSRLKKLQP